MKQLLTKALLITAFCAASMSLVSYARAQQTIGDNVALRQKVTVTPNPNYQNSPNTDPQVLTDGKYASENPREDAKFHSKSLWLQDGSISWLNKKPVIITVDLGKDQPISGVSYSTVGSDGSKYSGIRWPEFIYVVTSNDKKTWHYTGNLVELTLGKNDPPAGDYVLQRFATHKLKTHGRYVSFIVMQAKVMSVDEVEVFRGDDDLLNQSAGREIPALDEFIPQQTVTLKTRQRQEADIDAVREMIGKSTLSAQEKNIFTATLNSYAGATANMEPIPVDTKQIIPITDVHKNIFALYGKILAAQGFKPLTLWKKHRYAWLPIVNEPLKEQSPELHVSMLENQHRSDSILLTNASAKPLEVSLQLNGMPTGAKEGWLQLDSVIWSDTYEGLPVQDALIPLTKTDGVYSMEIPAGITGKLWVTIDSSKVPAGTYTSSLTIKGATEELTVPLKLDIANIAMGTPRLSLMVADYIAGKGAYGITSKNRDAALRLMRSHYVDTPRAIRYQVAPLPKEKDYDANNQLVTQLDFSELDKWIRMWHGARSYAIFTYVSGDTFAGAKMGTPAYRERIGSWIKATVDHMGTQGVDPSQIILWPIDEIHDDAGNKHLLEWGQAIRAVAPKVRLFLTAIWKDPSKTKYPEAFTFPDILTVHPDFADDYFVKLVKEHNAKPDQHKIDLWLYNGSGLARMGDPQLGYRQLAWRTFRDGGTGEDFWAFADLGGAPTSWNEYLAKSRPWAPVFVDTDTVYNSVHWDAVREGVEDFEELSMLKDAVENTKNSPLKLQARQVLDEAVKTATTNGMDNTQYLWQQGTDPTTVDAQLAKVRAMLVQLSK